jgi:hypothetical protein
MPKNDVAQSNGGRDAAPAEARGHNAERSSTAHAHPQLSQPSGGCIDIVLGGAATHNHPIGLFIWPKHGRRLALVAHDAAS